MHGFGWIKETLEHIEECAKSDSFERVTKVYINRGELSHYPEDELRLAFDCLKEGTVCSDAHLVIETIQARVECQQCDFTAEWSSLPSIDQTLKEARCPHCESLLVITEGKDVELVGVETDGTVSEEDGT